MSWGERQRQRQRRKPISVDNTVFRSSYSRSRKVLNIIVVELFSNYLRISQSIVDHSSVLLDVSRSCWGNSVWWSSSLEGTEFKQNITDFFTAEFFGIFNILINTESWIEDKAFHFPDLFDYTLWNIFQKIQNLSKNQ